MNPASTVPRVIVHGARGRMGQALLRLAGERSDLQLVAAVSRSAPPQRVVDGIAQFASSELDGLPAFDVAIDFSLPDGFDSILALCQARGAALVSGTTGLEPAQRDAMAAAATHIPLLWASNFSLGVAVLSELVERAAARKELRIPLEKSEWDPKELPRVPVRDKLGRSYATGIHSALGTDLYLKHVIGGDLQLAVDLTNDPRFMDTICPAGNLYTDAEQAGRFFEMLLNGGELDGKRIFSERTVFRSTLENTRPEIDRTLMIPMRYGMGPMLGANPVGLFGPMSKHAFGHLGFSNILCWADPERDISVALLSTGKSVVGTHLPALGNLLYQIATQCPRIPRAQRRSVFGHDSQAMPVSV